MTVAYGSSRKAIWRQNALLTCVTFTSEREKCFMLKFLRYHNVMSHVKPGPALGLVDCQWLLPSSTDPLDLKYPEGLFQVLLALT